MSPIEAEVQRSDNPGIKKASTYCCSPRESLTGRDSYICAVPVLLRVVVSLAALPDDLVDPVGLGRSALAWPRRGVELGISLVLARVAGVCSVAKKEATQEKAGG